MRAAIATVACVAALGSAATAQAAQRYAAPNGSGPAAECPQANPCSLKDAIEKAKENDEVIVGAGSYTVGGPIISQFEAANLDLHGDFGAPMPRITGSFIGTVLGINGAKSRISYPKSSTKALKTRPASTARRKGSSNASWPARAARSHGPLSTERLHGAQQPAAGQRPGSHRPLGEQLCPGLERDRQERHRRSPAAPDPAACSPATKQSSSHTAPTHST